MWINLLISLRPRQWIKNFIIYAGIIFSRRALDFEALFGVTLAFLLFCGLTGCVYIINYLKDREKDRLHPLKKKRPLASGKLSPGAAVGFLSIALPVLIALSFLLNIRFGSIALLYALLMAAYSFWLKEIVILDAFVISAGYVLRGAAGIWLIGVEMSPWFLICASLLALFIVFCKRKHELVILGEGAFSHRKILNEYNHPLADQLISVVTASAVVTYSLYTLDPVTVEKFNTRNLIFTIPFVLFGLFRFLYLVYKKEEGGSAETILFSDLPLMLAVAGWIVSIGLIIYGGKLFNGKI